MDKAVLIIEGDEQLREAYQLCFSEKGVRVLLATDGLEGLELAFRESVDFLILDAVMEGASGIEVLALLAHNQRTKEIPVLVVSDVPKDRILLEGHDAQVLDIVRKADFPPRKLADMVTSYLK